ncbi:flagellar FliL protein [Oceanisphaera litoralis]|uniref:flagellar basal body-associated FliL family protein n=1 Tax=Oceanisphaera litoralis TaxID=225144 RepID=UPI0019573A1E|nr:flagellar basal body-associated FliL family protein [Oceanisphaera litoralis]MBM7456568.1 flagellar FliL protein [Oceanisphaera litoralis]
MADELTMPGVAWYKHKLVWIAVTLLAVTAAGLTWWWMPGAEAQVEASVEDNQVHYVGFSRPFVFSVPAGRRDRLVQVEVQLMIRGSANDGKARRHLPLLESVLLTVFSRQSADNYLSAEGKQLVRQEALHGLNAVLTKELGAPLIEKVLFTGIVMQ